MLGSATGRLLIVLGLSLASHTHSTHVKAARSAGLVAPTVNVLDMDDETLDRTLRDVIKEVDEDRTRRRVLNEALIQLRKDIRTKETEKQGIDLVFKIADRHVDELIQDAKDEVKKKETERAVAEKLLKVAKDELKKTTDGQRAEMVLESAKDQIDVTIEAVRDEINKLKQSKRENTRLLRNALKELVKIDGKEGVKLRGDDEPDLPKNSDSSDSMEELSTSRNKVYD